jgi:hypothetical protein
MLRYQNADRVLTAVKNESETVIFRVTRGQLEQCAQIEKRHESAAEVCHAQKPPRRGRNPHDPWHRDHFAFSTLADKQTYVPDAIAIPYDRMVVRLRASVETPDWHDAAERGSRCKPLARRPAGTAVWRVGDRTCHAVFLS